MKNYEIKKENNKYSWKLEKIAKLKYFDYRIFKKINKQSGITTNQFKL